MAIFAQLVIGPPGAGKTTYCNGMTQMMSALKRKNAVINLDPANDILPYQAVVDVRDLITVEDVMEEFQLGPNGAMMYCLEYLLENLSWLEERVKAAAKGTYLLFDCPGQVELYMHHHAMREIVSQFQRWDIRLVSVHLTDCTLCTEPYNYISAVHVALCAMMQLELPHVNVLSKVDLLKRHRKELDFRLEYYTEASHLIELVRAMGPMQHPLAAKFGKFTEALCELLEDYSYVKFELLNIQDKSSTMGILNVCDQANGHVLSGVRDGLLDGLLASADLERTLLRPDDLQEELDEGVDGTEPRNRMMFQLPEDVAQDEDCSRCHWCSLPAPKNRCNRCKAAYYCDRECQRKAWPFHKPICTPVPQT